MLRYLPLLLVLSVSLAHAQPALYFPPKTGNTWQTIPPASLGFCPERIDSLYKFLETRNTKSFILLQDGKIVLEKYFGSFTVDSFWYWASAGKTATAFLVGQAQETGLLDIDNPTSAYLGNGWTSCPPNKEALITVRHQLAMTSGLDDNIPPTPAVPDPDNCTQPACLSYKADAGTRWAYHNAPYRLLHDVIEEASGQTINQFTKNRLLDRTGMKGFWFDHVLYGRARDMARFGLLTLAGGVWDGDTLLHDADYFYAMTHPSQTLNKSYGYLWWLNGQPSFMLPGLQLVLPGEIFPPAPDDLIAALGKNDQKIHVVPSKGWVVVRQGNDAGYTGPGGGNVPIYFDADMWDYINALVCTPSSTGETAATGMLQAYPNPAATSWTLKSAEGIGRVEVWNTAGVLVYEINLNDTLTTDIPAQTLPAGMYWARVWMSGSAPGQWVKLMKHP